jgi:hypothetical protein
VPFLLKQSGPPTDTKAFDEAFIRVLDQLANDLNRVDQESSPSAEDLRRVARYILHQAKNSSDPVRKDFFAQSAFVIAQLAEEMANASEAGTMTAPKS